VAQPFWRRAVKKLADWEWPLPLQQWIYKRGIVNRRWYYGLRLRSTLSRRIRVGFGPTIDSEYTLGLRKWHIDPIVDAINRSRSRYVADIYFPGEDLGRFDIAVIVKEVECFPPQTWPRLRALRTRLVYDIADFRYIHTPSALYDISQDRAAYETLFAPFVACMDALILSSPLQRKEFEHLAIPQVEIPRPLLNRCGRTAYAARGPIRLVWQGYPENLAPMRRLHAIVERLRGDTGLDVRLVYNTRGPARIEGFVEYVEWSIRRWERVLVASDVAVVIKPLDDPYQQKKPPTKVISYMGAGLPVVCTPSEADRGVIRHGETGFFAYDDGEWYDCLRALVTDAALRERVGMAARRYVTERYGVAQVAAEYMGLFDQVLAAREEPRR
jgi:hypothetical protein